MKRKTWPSSHASIRRHIFAGVVIVAFLAIGVGGWASTAEISGALIAQGSIVVDSNVKKVQHPTGGVVGELRVRDGDRVKAGDILIRLDETVTRANLAIVTKGLTELYARKARLAAERDGAETLETPKELAASANDPDVKEALTSERKLFELRRKTRLGQKDQLQQRVKQLQEQIAGLTAQQEAKSKEMALIEQELGGVRDLWAKNLVQINRLTSLEREEARLHGERGQLIAGAAEAKGKITETELQILQVDQELSSDVAKELREIDSKIGEYVERKVTAEDQLKRTDIRAPQNGVVFQSTANTVGGVITAGDPVMLIVPETDTLLVEVKVDPKDIDQVKLGHALLGVQPAHHPRAQRHRRAGRRRHHQRPAHGAELLHRAHLNDRRRDRAARRYGQAGAGHAGRSLHPDRRPHDDVLLYQAFARSAYAFVPGEVNSSFLASPRR